MVTVASNYMLRTLFTAWLEDYKVTRRARRWFREQGGGEGEDSEEEKDWYWPEGDDPVSSLPRNIAVKVSHTHILLFGHSKLTLFTSMLTNADLWFGWYSRIVQLCKSVQKLEGHQ